MAGAGKNAVSSQQGLGKKLLDGIDNLKSTGKALLKDEGGFLDLDALAGKKSVSGAVGKSGSNTGKFQKASFWERITKRKADVNELYANPLDEFSNPKIGPCESAVSKYIKQINQTGKLTNPIEVQKLADGGYEIVNGHHRWLAAKRTGLEKVPIRIKNYSN